MATHMWSILLLLWYTYRVWFVLWYLFIPLSSRNFALDVVSWHYLYGVTFPSFGGAWSGQLKYGVFVCRLHYPSEVQDWSIGYTMSGVTYARFGGDSFYGPTCGVPACNLTHSVSNSSWALGSTLVE